MKKLYGLYKQFQEQEEQERGGPPAQDSIHQEELTLPEVKMSP